jgi:hypothetical protein
VCSICHFVVRETIPKIDNAGEENVRNRRAIVNYFADSVRSD